jgi:hypothetical protein
VPSNTAPKDFAIPPPREPTKRLEGAPSTVTPPGISVFNQTEPSPEAIEALQQELLDSGCKAETTEITFLIMGASGDLAKRKIFPVLWCACSLCNADHNFCLSMGSVILLGCL